MTTISSIDARFAQDQVGIASRTVTASVANLVSGNKTDANVADLSVGTILATRVGTLRITVGNAGQAKSLLETAKGALDTVLSLLQQQKNLAVKSADDSLTDNERGFLNQEFQAIVSEINRISDNANFNGKTLLNGSISGVSTVETETGLSDENYGIISAGETELKGTVATGDLLTTASDKGVNRIRITVNGTTLNETGTLAITDGLTGGLTASVTFSVGATTNDTINNIVAAANSFSGTNARVAQNFSFVNGGDGSFTINAKEAGDHLNAYTFQVTGVTGATMYMGMDDTDNDVEAAPLAFNNDPATTDTSSGVDGTFMTRAAYNVGDVASVSDLAITAFTAADDEVVSLVITDVAGVYATVGETITIALTQNGGATTAADIIEALQQVMNGGITTTTGLNSNFDALSITLGGGMTTAERDNILNAFIVESTSSTTANISGAQKGTHLDGFTFQLSATTATNITATLGGLDADTNGGAARTLVEGTELATGALRATTTTEATVNDELLGGFENFKATFNQAATGYRNTVTFSVEVNGKTYLSDPVYLMGGATATDLGLQGNQIAANQEIVFYDPDGPKTANGDLTDNVFILKNGTSAITLADMSDAAKANESLATIADEFQTQLSSTTINQNRSLNLEQIDASSGDHRITAAVGTVLEGIVGFDSVGTNVANYNEGDITLLTDNYSSIGTLGNIGSFDVDRLRNRISTTIDGVEYTAYLSSDDLPSIGNVIAFGTNLDGTDNVGSYNSTTKILDLQDGTTSTAGTSVSSTAKLHFFSESTTDGKVLTIDLGNVSANIAQLNISTNEGELGLENALNGIFGVSSNESLSFQVGAAATDTIGVSIGSAKTTDIYRDSDGVAQVLSVATIEEAIVAGEVIDNAINNIVSLISDISASITSFNSAIQNNQASIQNADAARSKLLDTDYTQESTRFAEARVRVDAATSVLAQVNARIQNLLQLLQQ